MSIHPNYHKTKKKLKKTDKNKKKTESDNFEQVPVDQKKKAVIYIYHGRILGRAKNDIDRPYSE